MYGYNAGPPLYTQALCFVRMRNLEKRAVIGPGATRTPYVQQRVLFTCQRRIPRAASSLLSLILGVVVRCVSVAMALGVSVCVLAIAIVVLPRATVRAEMFTALVHMEGLVALEKELLGGLEAYLDQERER